jgi:putative CocE/NonD family hydrolase
MAPPRPPSPTRSPASRSSRGRARKAAGSASRVDCGNGVTVERDVRFRLSDGTVLVSDHYYPATPGPHPTLLVRQPYGRDIATTVVYAHPVWFARHGYNVVIQDVRGRGSSTGEFYPFRHEGKDGAETVFWLAGRPECNGRLGMYGFSYQGMTQLLAAAEQPAGLQCIAPAQTAGDLHSGWFYHQGVLRLASAMGWATQMLRADAHRLGLKAAAAALDAAWANLAPTYQSAPFGRASHLTARGLPSYYRDWVKNDRPGKAWAPLDISQRWDRIRVPALHLWGWYDSYLQGSVQLYEELCRRAGDAETREHQYVVAGPWTHIPWGSHIGEQDVGPAALLDTDALLLRWFNHWLKDSGEFAEEPRLRLFALGENQWHLPRVWPALGPTAQQRWFLRGNDRANSIKGTGVLALSSPESEEPRDIFIHDPEVPVLAPGGAGAAPGCFSQNRLEAGNNLLVYTSPVLTERLHVYGAPRVRVFLQSSRSETDLVVKLVRVTPDGRAWNVCIGAARSSHLFPGGSHRSDTVQCWEFALEPTSCVFAPGDRLRLEISSSAFPLYDRNPGSGVPASQAGPTDWQRAVQQVLHTSVAPSSIDFSLAT